MKRDEVLNAALTAVDRKAGDYGPPEDNFARIARLWNAHKLNTLGLARGAAGFTSTDVAIMLGLVKIARIEHDPKREDSWVDLAGYAACGAETVDIRKPAEAPDAKSWFVTAAQAETLRQSGITVVDPAANSVPPQWIKKGDKK